MLEIIFTKLRCLVSTGIILGASLGISTLAKAQTPTIGGELRKWHKVTLTFNGPNSSETATPNPFSDYRFEVTFTKGNKSYKVPGYYAACGDAAESGCTSGNKWRVHFAPDETGTWNYSVVFKQGDDVAINGGGSAVTPLDGATGTLQINASNKTGNDNRAKGRLRYVGEHYLQYAETGEWFFKVGADAPENTLAYDDFDGTPNQAGRRKNWQPHQQDYSSAEASTYTWQNGKGTEMLGMVKYLADQGMNAFSFLTFSLAGDDNNVFPHLLRVPISEYNGLGDDAQWNQGVFKDRFDVSKMAQWERIFEYADTKGMYLHFKTQETENDQRMDNGNVARQRKLYYRELIARFGHHLALNWNTGEENTQTAAQEVAMADYLAAIDPYNHNRVMHTFPNQKNRYSDLTGNQSKYTGASLQCAVAAVHNDTKTWVNNSRNAGKKWVVANDEQGDAQTGVSVDASYPDGQLPSTRQKDDNRKKVRDKVLWGNMLAGGAGVEYYYGYQTGCTDLDCQDHRTRASKWKDAKVAKDFFNQYLQANIIAMSNADGVTAANDDYVLAESGEIYVVYLPNGGSTGLSLPGGNASYEVQWFNPLTGNIRSTATLGGNLVAPDSDQDWVALILKGDDPTPPTTFTPYETIQGEDFSAQSGIEPTNNDNAVGFINNGDWIVFNNVAFGQGPGSGTVRASSNTSGGTVEFRTGSPTGTLVATTQVTNTGSWTSFQNFNINVLNDYSTGSALGTKNLYLVFKGNDSFLLDVDSFDFTPATTSASTNFVLINANNNTQIRNLSEGETVNKAQLPSNLSIGYLPTQNAGSVTFDLSGPAVQTQTESVAPYALNGDIEGDYKPFTFPNGNYTLTATVYSAAGGSGNVLATETVTFTVNNQASNAAASSNLSAYPNPMPTNRVTIGLSNEDSEAATYVLKDAFGKVVREGVIEGLGTEDSEFMLDFEATPLRKGMHYLTITYADQTTEVIKLIKE
ncbi:MAG: carbohydrate-binding protein [Thermonemataceae bacterium]